MLSEGLLAARVSFSAPVLSDGLLSEIASEEGGGYWEAARPTHAAPAKPTHATQQRHATQTLTQLMLIPMMLIR
jgi:hypothetical protein